MDMSPDGLTLRTDEEFVPGDLLAVMLPSKAERFTSARLVRVAEAEPHVGGRWQVSSFFLQPLNDRAFRAMVGEEQ